MDRCWEDSKSFSTRRYNDSKLLHSLKLHFLSILLHLAFTYFVHPAIIPICRGWHSSKWPVTINIYKIKDYDPYGRYIVDPGRIGVMWSISFKVICVMGDFLIKSRKKVENESETSNVKKSDYGDSVAATNVRALCLGMSVISVHTSINIRARLLVRYRPPLPAKSGIHTHIQAKMMKAPAFVGGHGASVGVVDC